MTSLIAARRNDRGRLCCRNSCSRNWLISGSYESCLLQFHAVIRRPAPKPRHGKHHARQEPTDIPHADQLFASSESAGSLCAALRDCVSVVSCATERGSVES